jgi:regulator of protease activity HflC (stomatin/prohibitin superfamily)
MNINFQDLFSPILSLIVVLAILYILYKYGTQEVLVEQQGTIRTKRKIKLSPTLIVLILVGLILMLISMSYRVIPQGYAGIKFNQVFRTYTVLGEGGNLIIPFLENLYQYDLQVREYTLSSSVKRKGEGTLWGITSDGISVGVEATLLYQINRDSLIKFHRNVGMGYEEKVIQPVFKSAIKSVISKYTSDGLLSFGRMGLDLEIKGILRNKLEPIGINVLDVLIRDIKFSPDYEKALEEKKLAEQEALKMQQLIKKESLNVQRMLVEAKGKAEAISILAKELKKNPEYVGYLYVDKLSDKIKVIITNEKSILNLDEVIKDK